MVNPATNSYYLLLLLYIHLTTTTTTTTQAPTIIMAITHFLIQSNFLPHNNNNSHALIRNYSPYNIITPSPKKTIMICFIMNQNTECEKGIRRNNNLKKVATRSDDDINEVIKNVIKAIHKPVIITGVVLLSMLFLYRRHHHVLAASGGDIGGSSFSCSYDDFSYDDDYFSSDDDYEDSPVRPQSVNELDGRVSMILFAIIFTFYFLLHNTSKTSLLKLQATLALLRHPDYCISGYSSVDVKGSVEECQKWFNELTSEERDDKLTLVNVNNIRRQSATNQISNGVCNEYIVVRIIVAASGVHELPPIKSSAQLKEALRKLASFPSTKIKEAEVLWTPQMENDTVSRRELLEDYPLLHPL